MSEKRIEQLELAFTQLVSVLENQGDLDKEQQFSLLRIINPEPVYTHDQNTKFGFGKYFGHTVAYVLNTNPSYILWCQESVEPSRFRATPGVLDLARHLVADRERYKALRASEGSNTWDEERSF